MEHYLRSQPLKLVQLIIPQSCAREFLTKVGLLAVLHFRDLNGNVPTIKRRFTAPISMLKNVVKKAQALMKMIDDEGFFVDRSATFQANQEAAVLTDSTLYTKNVEEIIARVLESDSRIQSLSSTIDSLKAQYAALCQSKEVYEFIDSFFATAASSSKSASHTSLPKTSESSPFIADSSTDESVFIAGTIRDKKFDVLNRLLFRALRGNIFMSKFPLSKSAQVDEKGPLCGFLTISFGMESTTKIQALSRAMKSNVISVEQNSALRKESLTSILAQIDDVYTLLYESQQTRRTELSKIGDYVNANLYILQVQLETFLQMNKFLLEERGTSFLIAEAWVAEHDIALVHTIVQEFGADEGVSPLLSVLDNKGLGPPSKFPSHPLFDPFLLLTHSYGVSSYQEINPSLFMVSTFPFLFAVMFGDLGHGFLLLVVAIVLFLIRRPFMHRILPLKGGSDMLMSFVDARFMVLLLAVHSMYAGIIYNDAFSRSMVLAPSGFKIENGQAILKHKSYVYPLGIDPVWSLSSNKLVQLNSYKMKQSIVMGVIHMLFGLFLSAQNYAFNLDYTSFFFEFIPRVVFFVCTFGYLAFLIVYKWVNPIDVSLISVFINMILGMGKVVKDQPLMFVGQEVVQKTFLALAIASIPVMLFGKTIYSQIRLRLLKQRGYRLAEHAGEDLGEGDKKSGSSTPDLLPPTDDASIKSEQQEGEKESIGDELMHSLIHSIEYILGSVSNTASYLRLWALSLAHAQLSEVLWDMVLMPGLKSPFKLVIALPFWLLFTIGILVFMEGMSAFLHALRLHWVEFNNKFFRAEGDIFLPFDLSPRRLASSNSQNP
jgi:V-type H+-transporting ATPase subunit a